MSVIRSLIQLFDYVYTFYVVDVYPLLFDFYPFQWLTSLTGLGWLDEGLRWISDALSYYFDPYSLYDLVMDATIAEASLCVGVVLILVFGLIWFVIGLIQKIIP